MEMFNETTGEAVVAHKIGTDNEGRAVYAYAEGCVPCEPYGYDEDGNWVLTGRVLALSPAGQRSWAPWNAVLNLMDNEIRENLHTELAPCSAGDFLQAYETAHLAKFGKNFVVN